MGKEFIEYDTKKSIPYTPSTICFCLSEYAKYYIKANRKSILSIDKDVRDAVLVDFINYMGIFGGADFGLHTDQLYEKRYHDEFVDGQSLLTVLFNYSSKYIFLYDMEKSVLRNSHMNNCKSAINPNDGAKVIVDFVNYVAEVNEFDRVFKLRDLYEKSKALDYKSCMKELKEFLLKAYAYAKKLESGASIDTIFNNMAKRYDLKSISEDGKYYYTERVSELLGQDEMFAWDKEEIEEKIYEMAYAYAKMGMDEEQPKTDIINKKILEMKIR